MLLEAHHLQLYMGDRLLFDVEHLHIDRRERIGLVGKNGSGKTTLLMTLAGYRKPDQGAIRTQTTVAYVPQLKRGKSTKSGGEQTQEVLVEALSLEPGLLLLDEPTTHLDAQHMEWLEKRLLHWPGAFVIASHDRAFLDALCSTIWEIRDGQVKAYTGNYSDYARQKEIEKQQQQLAYEKYVQKKQQLEEALRLKEQKAQRAVKAPKKVSPSEAKITGAKPYFAKKQKKLHQTAKAIEKRLEKLEKVERVREDPPIQMNLPHVESLRGKIVLRVQEVSGQVGGRTLWNPASFVLRGGEKLAILGPNGCGKTTLLNMIVRQEEGITLSPSLRLGYFRQDLSILDSQQSILENVRSTSSQEESLIRTVLARLHFRREDVYKPVGVLSGGERVKVALAKLFVSDINTLVLDEPTNYLDLDAATALESLLAEYGGTILFATHDRRLVQNIASCILVFDHGQLRLFEGSYEEYRQQVSAERQDEEREKQLLLLETRISEVLSRLSLEPSEELEREFERLLAEKKKWQQGG